MAKLQNNHRIESCLVEKLIFSGNGLGTLEDGRKVIISGGVLPQSVVALRVVRDRGKHVEAQAAEVITPSPLVQTLPAHFQVYGGCRWLPLPYEVQLSIKEQHIRDAFRSLSDYTQDVVFHSIVPSAKIYGYRNKVEFSFGRYISAREGIHDDFRFGFHVPGSYDRIENCTFCVLASDAANGFFRAFDGFARASGLPTYDPKNHEGFWRHLVIRSNNAGELMITVSANDAYEGFNGKDFFPKLDTFFATEGIKYGLVSAYFLQNRGKADIVDGVYKHVFGQTVMTEELLGLSFEIHPKSFFQTNAAQTEALYTIAVEAAATADNTREALDLYAGTGTIGLLLSRKFAWVSSIEVVAEASADGKRNAIRNNITHVDFVCEKTEDFLGKYLASGRHADALVVDPPREGLHPKAAELLPKFEADRIVYVSCNPATLARDLDIILKSGQYALREVWGVDMFPHTHHIETVVRLDRVY